MANVSRLKCEDYSATSAATTASSPDEREGAFASALAGQPIFLLCRAAERESTEDEDPEEAEAI